jgi:hypothetical protein
VRIEDEDVERFCGELNDKRYRNARPGFQDRPWGIREMTIADPFGNRVTFWQPVRTTPLYRNVTFPDATP